MSCVYWILHPPDGPLLTNVIQSLLVNFFLPTFKCLYFYFLLLLSYLFSFFSKDGLFWSAAAAPKTQLIRIYLKFCERDAKGRTQDWSTATNAEMKTKKKNFRPEKGSFWSLKPIPSSPHKGKKQSWIPASHQKITAKKNILNTIFWTWNKTSLMLENWPAGNHW